MSNDKTFPNHMSPRSIGQLNVNYLCMALPPCSVSKNQGFLVTNISEATPLMDPMTTNGPTMEDANDNASAFSQQEQNPKASREVSNWRMLRSCLEPGNNLKIIKRGFTENVIVQNH